MKLYCTAPKKSFCKLQNRIFFQEKNIHLISDTLVLREADVIVWQNGPSGGAEVGLGWNAKIKGFDYFI